MDFVTSEGVTIPNNQLTSPPPPSRSYAYCSDTLYLKEIVSIIEKVDLLFHETTFCHDIVENAILSKHTTARQAAELATAAQVGQLVTGHYSARYPNITPILEEARQYFENSVAGLDGTVHEVLWKKKK
jgi:ribonuclease Z